MKDVILYTKRIKLEFDADGVSTFNLYSLLNDIEKDYRMIDINPTISTFENYQYISMRVVKKTEVDKKPLGFSRAS